MGGAEVALLDMLASIRAAEPDWKLDLIVAGDGPLAAKASALGVNTIILPFSRSLARIGEGRRGFDRIIAFCGGKYLSPSRSALSLDLARHQHPFQLSLGALFQL